MIDTYLQVGFVRRLGQQLPNFKEKKPGTEWEFSHECETAKGNRRLRARAYIFPSKDRKSFIFKCHHCGNATSFGNLLKENNPNLYSEFLVESYKNNDVSTKKVVELPKVGPKPVKIIDAKLDDLIAVKSLPKSSPVIQWLERRLIPSTHYDLFYVAKDFCTWAEQYKEGILKMGDHAPRLVIPYFDVHGRVIGFTCRTFNPSVEPRYIHLRIDLDKDFVFGTERINPKKPIYVTEGQIDSLFINNAVAIGGAHYNIPFMQRIKTNCVIIPDQDWKRNSQVGKQLEKAIKDNFKVALLPDIIKGKDLNEIVKDGTPLDELKDIIDSHTYQGLEAQLNFALLNKWRNNGTNKRR